MYCELCKKDIEIVDIRHINVEHNITSKEYLRRFPDSYLEVADEVIRKNVIILKERFRKADKLVADKINIYSKIPIKNTYLRRALYKAFNGRCFYTGQQLKFKEMHIDHILPRSKGGSDCIANYVISSPSFNKRKKDKVFDNTNDLVRKNIETYSNLVLNELKSLL